MNIHNIFSLKLSRYQLSSLFMNCLIGFNIYFTIFHKNISLNLEKLHKLPSTYKEFTYFMCRKTNRYLFLLCFAA